MKDFEVLVKEAEQRLIKKNLEDIKKNIDNSDYTLKIQNYCDKFGFLFEDVKQQILTNDLVASFFAKDPSKQNFTEKLVEELLNSKVLPQLGKNCVRFTQDGEIVSKKAPNASKSADFLINNIYITQKYTRSTGGAQDNQFNDVVDFLIKGSKKHKVAAIVDGSFWDDKRDELKFFFKDNSNVSILSMNDILNGGFSFE